MAAVARAIPRPLSVVTTFAARALHGDVEGHSLEERCEPSGIRHARSEGRQKGRVGMAKAALFRIELVGAWLPMVEGKSVIGLRA